MLARDIMTTATVTVSPEMSVRDVAKLLLDKRISAVPVVGSDGVPVGIVSEGDLIRRRETGTTRPHAWWLSLFTTSEDAAHEYVKTHGGKARDVMTENLVTVSEDTPVEEIAGKLESHRIKRVPVLRDGRLVGIVSRADLIRGLASWRAAPGGTADDHALKAAVEAALREAEVGTEFVSAVVSDGVVTLWGAVGSDEEKRAVGVAAENVAGVKEVHNQVSRLPDNVRAVFWAE